MNKKVFEFTDDNFEKEVLGSSVPVLVDFWAQWCGPCKAMSPAIDELAVDFDGKFKVGKLNVDENPSITGNLNILNIPTIIFFKNGGEEARIVGLNSKADISRKMKELL